MDLIERNIEKFKSLCERYHVDQIYLFGSARTANFNPDSDIDFLVRFKKIDLAKYFDNYINFRDKLKELFGREIDLVEEQTLKNPILINSIEKNKELIYGR